MLEWNYPSEKLSSACRFAIGSDAPLHVRLQHVVSEIHHALRHAPAGDLRTRMEKLCAQCEAPPFAEEGTIAAGCARLSDIDASELLGEAFDILMKVEALAAIECV